MPQLQTSVVALQRVGSPGRIENAGMNFKVEISWVRDKKIDKSSIILNRYNDAKWNSLPTSLSGEDDNYLHFTSKTSGFSPFVITGKTAGKEAVNKIQPGTNHQSLGQNNSSAATNTITGSKKLPVLK